MPLDVSTGASVAVVHPRWRRWAAENLARGATRSQVQAELVAAGVTEVVARELVAALVDDAAMSVARELASRVAALELVLRLRLDRHAGPQARTTIERTRMPDAETFVARHWQTSTPAIFTDVVTSWPAMTRWGRADLLERFADVDVEICVGRCTIDRPDAEWRSLRRTVSMREFLARIDAASPANDVYMIARNAGLCRPELAPLLDDMSLPLDVFGPALVPRRLGLWIGGAGTHSPMHHDLDDSVLCQVVGRKRVRLAPPEAVALLDGSRGVYSWWDPRDPEPIDAGPAPLLEFVLEPGEMLYIPSGWWHQVDALDFSISVNALHFPWPNDHAWYLPGRALRGG